MPKPFFYRTFVAALILLGITTLANAESESAPEKTGNETAASEEATDKDKGLLPLESLRLFTEVFNSIKQAYVEEIDDSVLLENAVKGMLSKLDPHSAYLEEDAFSDLQENTKGEFGGLGIEVQLEDGFVRVVTPIDDTPAIKAGIEPQDLIIKIDGESVKGLSLQESVKKMRGEPGTQIVLTIVREGNPEPVDITITRAIIKITSVKHRSLEPGFGYIRITQFQADTGREVIKAISKLKEDESNPLQGLVLDLRNNPGGVLSAAVEVSDAFLQDGLIVYTEGRIPNSDVRYTANAADPSGGIPVVVLINGGSASASEIVAGAIQDNRRGIVMGTESFGKGSVQTIVPLPNNRGLKITTARYFTPSGRSIQAEGIDPDIIVESAKVTRVARKEVLFKEKDLPGHLDKKKTDSGKDEEDNTSALALAEQDFQLYEALNLLKGFAILGANR